MKVILKHGTCNYEGNRYSAGDSLDITEHFYNSHLNKFDKAVAKKAPAQVIHNDEQTKKKSEKTQDTAKPKSKPAGDKSAKPNNKKEPAAKSAPAGKAAKSKAVK